MVAFNYTDPIATACQYPWNAKINKCNIKPCQGQVKVFGYKMVPENDAEALLSAIADTPVSVSIWLNKNFKHYESGVFNKCPEDPKNKFEHAVLAVGYGYDTIYRSKYILVKNSWGTNWGEKGYFRIL
jgi:C1A family cysteine protease